LLSELPPAVRTTTTTTTAAKAVAGEEVETRVAVVVVLVVVAAATKGCCTTFRTGPPATTGFSWPWPRVRGRAPPFAEQPVPATKATAPAESEFPLRRQSETRGTSA
jgi:hypothetical protein